MAAGKHNFTIEQGTTSNFLINYRNNNNEVIPLTGYSAEMQIRPDYADITSEKYLILSSSLDTDGSGLIINEDSGSILINISAEKTDSLKFEQGFYDLEIRNGSYVVRLLEGKFKVKKSVTR